MKQTKRIYEKVNERILFVCGMISIIAILGITYIYIY